MARYRPLLRGGFGDGLGPFNPQKIVLALEELRKRRQWMEAAVARVQAAHTIAELQRLVTERQQVRERTQYLWPSEQRLLQEQLAATYKRASSKLMATSAEREYPATLEGARALAADIDQRERLGVHRDDPGAAREWRLAQLRRIDELLSQWSSEMTAALQALPKTLEGIRAAAPEWMRKLNQDSHGLAKTPTINKLKRSYGEWRQEAIESAYPEWEKWLSDKLKTEGGVKVAELQLNELFPGYYASGALYERYAGRVQVARARIQNATQLAQMEKERNRARQYGYIYRPPEYWKDFNDFYSFQKIFDGESTLLTEHEDHPDKFRLLYLKFTEAYSANCDYFPHGRQLYTRTQITSYDNSAFVDSEIVDQYWVDSRSVPKFEHYMGMKLAPGETVAGNLSEGMRQARELMRNPVASLDRIMKILIKMRDDYRLFFSRESCTGPTTQQFAENLLRMAEGRPTIQEQRIGTTLP
jgi:hypothetical protein